MTITRDDAAREIMRMLQEAIRLAPTAGLHLAITITEAKK